MKVLPRFFRAVIVTTEALLTASVVATAQPYPGLIAVDPATTLQLETGSVDIKAVAPIPGGGAYVAGDFQRAGSMRHVSLVRLKEDGSLDTSFAGFDTRHTAGLINALLVQPDGKLVVGGFFGPISGRNHLVRLNPDGSLDTTFATNGFGNMVSDLKATPTGKILVTGNFANYYSATGEVYRLAERFYSTPTVHGTLRSPHHQPTATFWSVYPLRTADSSSAESSKTSSQLRPANSLGSTPTVHLIPISPAGGGFNPTSTFQIYALQQQSDGKIVVGGNFSAYAGNSINGILRLTSDGLHDLSFNPFLSAQSGGL